MIKRIYRWWKLRRLKRDLYVYVIEYEYCICWNCSINMVCIAIKVGGVKSYRLMTDAELVAHSGNTFAKVK